MTVVPIAFFLLGALITWLIRDRHTRTQWVVASVSAFIAWAYVLFLDVGSARSFGLSIWQPADLFQSPISFTIDTITWPLIYGAATVLLAVVLTCAAQPHAATAGARSFWFFYTGSALIAIMSANLLTVVIAWALMDFGALFFLLKISESDSARRSIFVRAGVNAVGVMVVFGAAMASDIQGITALDLASTSAAGILMLALAALLRLGLVPLHYALPTVEPLRREAGTLLRLFPPVVAISLLARVFDAGLPPGLRGIFLIAGGIGGIFGGLRWVLQDEMVRARPFFVLALVSLGLIIAVIAPDGAMVLVATGVLLLLVGAVLSLFAQHTPSHRVIPVLSAILLVGAPFTPGAIYAAAVANPETVVTEPLMSSLAVITAALLALGCIHLFFAAETPWPIGESLGRVMFNIGLILPILAALGIGLWRIQADYFRSGIFALTALVLGAGFFLGFRRLSTEHARRLRHLFQFIEPGRLYRLIWRVSQRALVELRGLGELFEGGSGMLWLFVFVIFLLLILL
ncbi:MAG: hypothetical protein P1P76_00540 [Anaerolineales bacterium]|nr:hypothetical protein [Anaerolineales bacterium]